MREGFEIGREYAIAQQAGDEKTKGRLMMDVLLDIRSLLIEQNNLLKEDDSEDLDLLRP